MVEVKKGRWMRLLAGVAAAGLLAAACGDTTEQAATDGGATDGGTTDGDGGEYCTGVERDLIWAHEQEPSDMHLDDPNNNLSITSWIQQSFFEGLYGITADTTFFPELLAEEGQVTENDDGSVTIDFTLRDGLTWSDGTPLTAEHVKGTFDIIMEGFDPATGEGGIYLIGDRTGYDTITNFEVTSDTEFSITWSEFFAGYPALFARVFPTHIVTDAATANEAFKNMEMPDGSGFLPGSGPMVYDGRQQGVSMHLKRNDQYHGSASPDVQNTGVACVTGVQINWVADTDAQVNALQAGEADLIFTQPQVQFGEAISSDEQFTIASQAGPVYEHWGFNLFNDHLKNVAVREAIVYAVDKGQVINTLYAPLFGDLLPEAGLGNTYWMSNQPPYEDHQETYAGAQTDKAAELLEGAGYTKGSDGIYTHPELGRLSLRVGTTGGNRLRELQQQILIEQLKAAGIEVTVDNVPGSDYFSERPFSEQALACAQSGGTDGDCSVWDITQFAWVGGPWPGSNSAAYRSGSGNNPYGYANPEFDAKAAECDATVDDDERAACYNEADKYITTTEIDPNGLVVMPLTQKPSYYAYNNQRLAKAAVSPDANDAGPLVNVVDYAPAA